MSKKKPTKEEIKEMIDNNEAEVHEVPPYTKISISVTSEGFQVELEENTPFNQSYKNYETLLKDIIQKNLIGKPKKQNHDDVHKNVDVT